VAARGEVDPRVAVGVDLVELVEPGCEAARPAQPKVRAGSRGGVAGTPHYLGQEPVALRLERGPGRRRRGDAREPGRARHQPGEDRGVRRDGPAAGGVHVGERRAATRQLRDRRRAAGSGAGGLELDAGCGSGNITSLLLPDREQVVAVDVWDDFVAHMRARFAGAPNLAVHRYDLADPAMPEGLRGYELDSAICVNVLEHVEDHRAA